MQQDYFSFFWINSFILYLCTKPKLYMNAEYHAALNRLKSKIGLLVSQYEHIKAENERMAIELTTLKLLINENRTTISELEQKVNRLQLAEAFKSSSVDVREAKQKIAKLIKEIDKCIALLNT